MCACCPLCALTTRQPLPRRSRVSGQIAIGLESLTPEIKVTDRQVNLLGHIDISHSDVSVSQKVKMDNPDSDRQVFMSFKNANKLGMTSVSADVYGSLT